MSDDDVHKANTVPPPDGDGDAYSQATVVREAPPDILDRLKELQRTKAKAQENAAQLAASPPVAVAPPPPPSVPRPAPPSVPRPAGAPLPRINEDDEADSHGMTPADFVVAPISVGGTKQAPPPNLAPPPSTSAAIAAPPAPAPAPAPPVAVAPPITAAPVQAPVVAGARGPRPFLVAGLALIAALVLLAGFLFALSRLVR